MCTTTNGLTTVGNERVHYFSRQLITADDMMAEQEYFRQKLRRHNRYLHGWGVVCGCAVVPPANAIAGHPWTVVVCPGYLITPEGDEIVIENAVTFDVAGDSRQLVDPCANAYPCPKTGMGAGAPAGKGQEEQQFVYLVACYTECQTRPVRLHPTGCACDDSACDYSRIRDSFELRLLQTLPVPHRTLGPAGVSCPSCERGSCVVLASIIPPNAPNVPIQLGNISYRDRRALYSVSQLPLPPAILQVFPQNLETNIDPAANLTANFSRQMNLASFRSPKAGFTLDGQAGTVNLDATGMMAIMTPANAMAQGMHAATITAQVSDTYGTPLVGDFTWTFWVA
jgi:hypothetical protein